METRPLGNTGLDVSALGFGAGPLGSTELGEPESDAILREAIELGITVFDTAPSYGASEERLGRVLKSCTAAERDRLVVVTKGGYGVEGVEDWTPEVITRGIDQATERLGRVDVFLLHSCPLERLIVGDLFPPLEAARKAGKVRAIGYSGDGAPLAWALRYPELDVVECSVNLLDQEALGKVAQFAHGKGVLAKRALAGAPWRHSTSAYADRWRIAYATPFVAGKFDWDELAIRFAAFAPGITAALMGTRELDHLRRAVSAVERGALPEDALASIDHRFAAHAEDWLGVI